MKIYAHYVEPEKYPTFDERPFPCVTHSSLNNEIQFVSARFFPVDGKTNRFIDIEKTISRYADNNSIGKCFWLNWKVITVDNFYELIDKIAERKMWVFGFWGFVPGEKADTSKKPWGEFLIPGEFNDYLLSKLGNHFLGYELGEQDGRFTASYICRQTSAFGEHSREKQYLKFHAFMNRIENNFYRHTVLLASLPFQHYFARDNTVSFLGCASAQALPNSQMWYSFVRGASKQYGLLCFGDVSVWNRWGYKSFSSVKNLSGDDRGVGVEYGTSLSLIKRLIYSQYMYNCDLLGVEQSWFYDDDIEKYIENAAIESRKNGQLSPIGKLQQSVNRYVEKFGKPGAMYTPLALIMDFCAGWVPPRTLFSKNLFQVWGSLPYNSGDYQTHALFSMLYPGYENSGFFHNETGFLTSTPYGEISDVILSDTPIEILRQYKAAIIMNDTTLDYEFYSKLKTYVFNGGHVILFAGLIYRNSVLCKFDPEYFDFFGVSSDENKYHLKNEKIFYGEKSFFTGDILLYNNKIPGSRVLAETESGIAAAMQKDYGNGKVTVFLTDDGLECPDYPPMLYNDTDSYIFSPYDFTGFVKKIYDDILRDLRLIYPDNQSLQYIVDVSPDGDALNILVNNNTYVKQRFDLEADIAVDSISENDTGCDLSGTVGYYPIDAEINNNACSGSGSIELKSGDTKLFHIALEQKLEIVPALYPVKPSARYFVRVPDSYASPVDFILRAPMLRQHFSGLVLNASDIEKFDISTIQKDAGQFDTLGLKIIVDFSSLLNHYPDFSFCKTFEERCEESYKRLDDILDKILLYPCIAVILSAVQNPEGNSDTQILKDSMLELFRHVNERVKHNYIRVIAMNTPVFFSAEEMYRFLANSEAAEIGYNCSAGIATETPQKKIFEGFNIPFLIACAPYADKSGQLYDTCMPIYNSEYRDSVLQAASDYKSNGGNTFILNACYSDYSEAYADFELLNGIII